MALRLAPLAIRALISFLPRDVASNALDASPQPAPARLRVLRQYRLRPSECLAPALHAGGDNLVASLRERGGTGFGGVRLRKCIVTLQVAFSLILIIGAALFLRTLSGLLAKGPGFDTSSLVSFSLDPEKNGYSQDHARQLIRRIDAELRAAPATRNSAVARDRCY